MPEISLSVRSLSSHELLSSLRGATIDVALMRPTAGDDRFASETIREEPLIAVLPSKHRLSRSKTITLSQLAKERWLIPYPDASGFNVRQTIDAFFEKHKFTPVSIQEADNVLANLILVGSGMGVGLLPQYVQELRLTTVNCKPLTEPAPTIQLLMAYHWESSSTASKLFLDIVREIMKTYT
jgi:LysR family transcriptional regulator, hca operon transcriptional activator